MTSQRSGFTLAELLVVITILSILFALVGSVVGTALRAAGRAACMSNLRQVGAACQLYAIEHGNRLPSARSDGRKGAASMSWYYQLPAIYDEETVNGRSIFQCPNFRWNGPQVFSHASPKSYKMNGYLEERGRGTAVMDGRHADEVVLFADAVAGETGMGQWGHLARTGLDGHRHGGAINMVMTNGAVRTITQIDNPDRKRNAVDDAGLRWTP